jgi:hypothetical protein
MHRDASENTVTFEKKMYIRLPHEKIQTISTQALQNVIAEAVSCKVEIYKDEYRLEAGQCYIVRFQDYDTLKTLNELSLKTIIWSFCTPHVNQTESELNAAIDWTQGPIRFEHNGGKLL